MAAANKHGVWNETGASQAFYVAAFFYQRWSVRIGAALALTLLIAAAVRWRIRELRKIERLEREAALANERSRIAKDLHDGLGADFNRLSLLAELAERNLHQPESGASHLRKLALLAREAAQGLKSVIWSATPAAGTFEGLITRLCQETESHLKTAGIRCRLELPETLPCHPISPDVRQNLLLAVREAVNNTVKHAGATEVRFRVMFTGQVCRLEIEDNGRGFPASSARDEDRVENPVDFDPLSTRIGLRSMRQRIETIGGRFELSSTPGVGTRITIEIPNPHP